MSLSIALDILLVILLALTVGYAAVLNRRLRVLRYDKKKFEKFAASFSKATVRAEQSVGLLKESAEDISRHITKAQTLRDDLAFLIDRGGSEADRLEETVRAARKKNRLGAKSAGPAAAPAAPAAAPAAPAPPPSNILKGARSQAERELLRALEGAR